MKHKIIADHAHEMWSLIDELEEQLSKIGQKIIKVRIRVVTAGLLMWSRADVWDNAESKYIEIRNIGNVAFPSELSKNIDAAFDAFHEMRGQL